jgi:two-component system, response regulator PdtaR
LAPQAINRTLIATVTSNKENGWEFYGQRAPTDDIASFNQDFKNDVSNMALPQEDQPSSELKKTILVVDDEVALRFLISVVLREESNLKVIEAHNADEALSLLNSDIAVDLIFTDVRMPGTMDGIELTRRVRATYPEIKIVMASGHLTQQERIPGVPLFLKPYDIDDVKSHILAVIEGQSTD